MAWLADQLGLALAGRPSVLQVPPRLPSVLQRSPAGGFCLAAAALLHMFISTAPCGDARIFSLHEATAGGGSQPQGAGAGQGKLRSKIESGMGTMPLPEGGAGTSLLGLLQLLGTEQEQTVMFNCLVHQRGPEEAASQLYTVSASKPAGLATCVTLDWYRFHPPSRAAAYRSVLAWPYRPLPSLRSSYKINRWRPPARQPSSPADQLEARDWEAAEAAAAAERRIRLETKAQVAREEKRRLAAAGGAGGRAGVEAEIAESRRQAEEVVAEGEVQRAGARWSGAGPPRRADRPLPPATGPPRGGTVGG